MAFKFDLRQRVTLPGSDGMIQAYIVGRGEDVHAPPQYRLAYVDQASACITERCFSEAVIIDAQPQPVVITASRGESLTRARPAKR